MAGRYLVTGIQLGMIQGLLKVKDFESISKLVNTLIQDQWIDHSDKEIEEDVKNLLELCYLCRKFTKEEI